MGPTSQNFNGRSGLRYKFSRQTVSTNSEHEDGCLPGCSARKHPLASSCLTSTYLVPTLGDPVLIKLILRATVTNHNLLAKYTSVCILVARCVVYLTIAVRY
jgi:hypothetical protein